MERKTARPRGVRSTLEMLSPRIGAGPQRIDVKYYAEHASFMFLLDRGDACFMASESEFIEYAKSGGVIFSVDKAE
jgi:hypothetical protein